MLVPGSLILKINNLCHLFIGDFPVMGYAGAFKNVVRKIQINVAFVINKEVQEIAEIHSKHLACICRHFGCEI